ncbi:unnamed protein product [Urochloa humidicola]
MFAFTIEFQAAWRSAEEPRTPNFATARAATRAERSTQRDHFSKKPPHSVNPNSLGPSPSPLPSLSCSPPRRRRNRSSPPPPLPAERPLERGACARTPARSAVVPVPSDRSGRQRGCAGSAAGSGCRRTPGGATTHGGEGGDGTASGACPSTRHLRGAAARAGAQLAVSNRWRRPQRHERDVGAQPAMDQAARLPAPLERSSYGACSSQAGAARVASQSRASDV